MIVVHKQEASPWRAVALSLTLTTLVAGCWGYSKSRELDAARRELDATSTELAVARQQVQQALKRELPVSLSYSSGPHAGMVAILKSDLPRPLELVAVCSSVRTGRRKRFNLVIPANGEVEIGHDEGWSFMPGQRIVLSNAAFRQAEYLVPARRGTT